jgi:hypothetical protein
MVSLRVGTALLALCALGCQGPQDKAAEPGDPEAVSVLLDHWHALQRRDWRGAYERLHPDLKHGGFTLKRFSDLHARRLRGTSLPDDIKVTGTEQMGDAVVVAFDVLIAPLEGGPPAALSPSRHVTLRRAGRTWGLATSDLLAVSR